MRYETAQIGSWCHRHVPPVPHATRFVWADSFTGTVTPSSQAGINFIAGPGDTLNASVDSVPTGTITSLEIVDPNGFLIASGTGNIIDSSTTLHNVPAVLNGIYLLEVIDPGTAPYNFSLQISGFTEGTAVCFKGCGPIPTPEPSSLALCLLALIALAVFHQRRRPSLPVTPPGIA